MLNLNWKQINPYNRKSNLDNVTEKPGIYILSCELKNNTYKVVYVGQTLDLQRRLKEHLRDDEKNLGIKEYLDKYCLKAVYAEVTSSNLDGVELYLYNKFDPKLNEQTPPGTTEIPVGLWY